MTLKDSQSLTLEVKLKGSQSLTFYAINVRNGAYRISNEHESVVDPHAMQLFA